MVKRQLILGIGNPLRCDDAVGLEVARSLAGLQSAGTDVKETEEAGLALLELMHGYERVILVDALRAPPREAGRIVRFTAGQLERRQGRHSSHMLSLPRLLAAAERLDLEMPMSIVVVAVKIAKADEFGEGLSPAVRQVVARAAELVRRETAAYAGRKAVPAIDMEYDGGYDDGEDYGDTAA